ncbi:hypothetical protein K6W36_19185, partial [Acetobacter senegalensis]|uniref:hypothetical protein n=1 Tax=Acetobacter senegalensis TaxID=446692 RepID=UPI001EDAEF7F
HASDEAEASVDADVGFVAEDRQGDHEERRPICPIPDFSADLECLASVGILLCCLVRLVRPNVAGALP